MVTVMVITPQLRAGGRGGGGGGGDIRVWEDLFVFNDSIEGPRAPAVKPGRVTQPDESEGCSPSPEVGHNPTLLVLAV